MSFGAIFSRYKSLIIIILVTVFGIIGGVTFFGASGGTPAVSPEVAAETSRAERELLDELLELRAIKLSESFFANPLFLSLTDFSKPLSEQPVGRSNPFAPLPRTGQTTAQGTTTATGSAQYSVTPR